MQIADFLHPREEVIEGQFQGVLQAHKVGDSTDRLENDPRRLLSMTYPSNALQTAFERVDDKLRGSDSQGGITLSGPYGAGKSHGLITLYHLFNSPGVSKGWLAEWEIDLPLPDTTRASILSTSETDADQIWEPVFDDLNGSEILEGIKRYPTTEHIEELVGEDTVAIFFDEIETWWESFDRNEDGELLERNEFFLQNLLEVANDPEKNLFVFITLLDKSPGFKRILNRTNPYAVDMNDTGDRERIILHRLFETPREEIDESGVRDVVEDYTDHYNNPIDPEELGELQRYEDRMVETYPFHPELLELLDRLYEAGREQQSVRGAMNVLADTVSRKYDETDLIVTCDIRPAAFRGMNQTLFNRYVSDRDHVKDIDFGDDLLRTILLYTLDDRSQMATVTQCLLGTFKPEKSSVDKLNMSLSSLYGTAHYLDRDSGGASYYITEDPKLTALVTREQNRVLEDDSASIEETLVDIVRNDVWDGDVLVHPNDDVPDNDSLSVVVTLSYLSNGTLEAELSEFFEGRTYQNTVLFVTPKKQLLEDDDIIKKAARVLGAQNLQGKVDDDKGELSRLIRDERRELTNELSDRYGKWVKWSVDPSGDLRMRRKNVAARVNDVENSVGRDKTYVSETILDEVEGTPNGITLKSMKNDFKQFRRMPVLIDDNLFYSAVRKLFDDEKIVLEGDHAKFYVPHKGDRMPDLEDSLVLRHPDSLDDAIFEEEEDPTTSTTGTEGGTGQTGGTTTGGTSSGGGDGSGTTSIGGTAGGGGGTTVGTTTTTKNVHLEGNSGRVLRSMAESRISETEDTVTHIDLSYDVDGLSKEELIEFLQQLPSANHIGADLVIENETDE